MKLKSPPPFHDIFEYINRHSLGTTVTPISMNHMSHNKNNKTTKTTTTTAKTTTTMRQSLKMNVKKASK
jgi:hypothetical protein